MNRLFIHKPLFRLLSPILNGTVVYLLILLINNNVAVIDTLFIGQELYFCIGLSYLTQEFSRLAIVFLSRRNFLNATFTGVTVPVIVCSLISSAIVTGSMYWYFESLLGYSPIRSELIIFNALFMVISWIYISLFIAHDVLNQTHELRVQQERQIKENIEEEFHQFKEGIKTDLLFESLEQLILLSKTDLEKGEELIDQMALVYRYVLSRKQELVEVQDEMTALQNLIDLLNNLPNRNIVVLDKTVKGTLVVPGTFLKITEHLVRNSVSSPLNQLRITITEGVTFMVQVHLVEKLQNKTTGTNLAQQLTKSYQTYTDDAVRFVNEQQQHSFFIPKLTLMHESTDH